MAVLRQMRIIRTNVRNRINVLVIVTLLALIYFWRFLNDSTTLPPLPIEVTKSKASLIKTELPQSLEDLLETVAGTEKYFVPSSMNKIDWHDYELILKDEARTGPGEQGLPTFLPQIHEEIVKSLYSENNFNAALSDRISLNRSLPDLRHVGCRLRQYLESLPTVSVVVPFHNEHWSTLLRTVYSVLNRSPAKLLKEIFLVDDASTKNFLKQKLDNFVALNLPKVKVIRLKERSGLISARLAGAKAATADVIICLDSHTEATHTWLPPLLEPIALNYKTVVCPLIDIMMFNTFEYHIRDTGARGAFDWEFYYRRLPLLPKDKANMPEPFESPVMAGGVFAISRTFFWELGGYDPGLDIWGGEQFELSFKTWQCGGRLLEAPCSRVGHLYRDYFPPFPDPGHGEFVSKNYRRVAEVWMDEYAQYLYNRRPHYRDVDPGDISELKALRKKLNCKPFKWFMTQIAFDALAKYPVVDQEPYATGQIRPVKHLELCVDAYNDEGLNRLQLKPCSAHPAAQQDFVLGWFKDIKSPDGNVCWDLQDSEDNKPVLLASCHQDQGNQCWRYLPDKKQILHVDRDKCLAWHHPSRALFVLTCDEHDQMQQWTIDNVNQSMMDQWEKNRLRVAGPSHRNRRVIFL